MITLMCVLTFSACLVEQYDENPNFVFILVDDMGWMDGYWGEWQLLL